MPYDSADVLNNYCNQQDDASGSPQLELHNFIELLPFVVLTYSPEVNAVQFLIFQNICYAKSQIEVTVYIRGQIINSLDCLFHVIDVLRSSAFQVALDELEKCLFLYI